LLSRRERAALEVPALGELILSYVCSPEILEGMLGDLEEHFRKLAKKQGVAAARRWYRWQVARSVVGFALNFLVRVVSIWELLQKLGL
jgi:hypothetical protein